MIMNTITETKNIVTSMPIKRCSINLVMIHYQEKSETL